jgi:hypothetical protein
MVKTQFVLVSRGLLTAHEVLALLSHGFAKGAMARARTLHELTVVSDFIAKRGLRAARRYVDHYDVERLKAEKAKLKELAKKRRGKRRDLARTRVVRQVRSDILELERRQGAHVRRYGKRFKDENGWAAPWWRGAKTRVTFAMLEKRVHLDRARPYYKHASFAVHAGPLGVLDNYDDAGVYIVGANTSGLDVVAANAPMWLAHLLSTATGAIDGDNTRLLPRVIAMASLALDVRQAFERV